MNWEGENEYEFPVRFVCTELRLDFTTQSLVTYAPAFHQTNKPSQAQKETRTLGIFCLRITDSERGGQLRAGALGPGRRRAQVAPGLGSGRFLNRFQGDRSGAGLDAPHSACSAASDSEARGPAPRRPRTLGAGLRACLSRYPGQELSVSAPNWSINTRVSVQRSLEESRLAQSQIRDR